MDEGKISEIKSRIDVIGFYSRYVTWVNKSGANWQAKCPFPDHEDKDPSFSVEVSSGRFICFGCKKHGHDVISFYEQIEHCDFDTAIRKLAEEAGVEIPPKKKGKGRGRPKGSTSKPHLNEETIDSFHNALSIDAIEYLNSRGITNEIIQKHKIGQYREYLVFPIRRKNIPHNYKFKHLTEKRIWQLSEKDIGHNPIWVFPEPDQDAEEILLCEGEIDALNAIGVGFNATTITGGAGTWRDEFLDFFRSRKVFICYDIDESGKKGVKKVGQHISNVAKETRIVKLDLDPEKYPTGDLNDYFVKEGKTKNDLLQLMKDSEFSVVVPETVSVVEDDGCYFSTETDKHGNIKYDRITNFTIRLHCKYKMQNGDIVRSVRFVHSDGKRISEPLMMSSDDMSTIRGFKNFCFRFGDNIYEGNEKNLTDIWYLVLAQDPQSRVVHSAFKIGWVPRLRVWVFENVTIKDNKTLLPDENGICWNGNMGYTYTPIEVSGADIVECTPKLIISKEPTIKSMQKFSEKLVENIGSWDCLYGLGLACGSIYFHEIVKAFGCYPILWAYGKLRCGKNEYIGFLMRMFGLGRQDCESLPGITSTVPITRRLSYYSNVPVWFDEYRNNLRNSEMVKGVFRSAYGASGRSLGVKDSQGVLKEKTCAPIFISGEELPEDDEALLSRLVIVHLKLQHRQDKFYNDVFNFSQESSAHIYNLIVNKSNESTKSLIEEIDKMRESISSNYTGLNARVVLNHAIMLGCYRMLVNPNDKLLTDYVAGSGALDGRRDFTDGDSAGSVMLNDFIENISTIISSKQLKSVGWYKVDTVSQTVAVWLRPIYIKWAEQHRRITGLAAPSDRTILDHLKETDFFLETGKKVRIFDPDSTKSIVRSCFMLDLAKLPDNIKGWFSGDLPEG